MRITAAMTVAVFVLAAAAAAGCERSLRLRAVDARSGEPLGGVTVSHAYFSYDYIFGEKSGRSRRVTGRDGFAEFRAPQGPSHSFALTRAGYLDAAAIYTPSSSTLFWSSPVRAERMQDRPGHTVKLPDVARPTFEIPMHVAPPPQDDAAASRPASFSPARR
jgi:hypothetical protein